MYTLVSLAQATGGGQREILYFDESHLFATEKRLPSERNLPLHIPVRFVIIKTKAFTAK